MSDDQLASATGFFALLFRPIRTEGRSCDEDQLTAALAGCCKIIPGFADFIAREVFDTPLDETLPSVDLQMSDPTSRYDLVLGKHAKEVRPALVLEHKLESNFSSGIQPQEGEKAPQEGDPLNEGPAAGSQALPATGVPELQVERYLRETAKWATPPRVGALVKYPQNAITVDDPRWAGCRTWTDLDAKLAQFPDATSEIARVLVPELRILFRHLGAVMEAVPQDIDSQPEGVVSLSALLDAALPRLVPPWKRLRFNPYRGGFYYRLRSADGKPAGLSYRPGHGTYIVIYQNDTPLPDEPTLARLGFRLDDHSEWGEWYRSNDPLSFDFTTHRTWAAQLQHATAILRKGLAGLA